jgi:ferritin
MANYDLGSTTFVSHDVNTLTEAIGIPEIRFDDLVALAKEAWEHEDTISESLEYIVKRVNGSELILTLVFFGRIWEGSEENLGRQ